MRKQHRRKQAPSMGTIFMSVVTILVLVGFLALLPKITGQSDLRINAENLFAVVDTSIDQISNYAVQVNEQIQSMPDSSKLIEFSGGQDEQESDDAIATAQVMTMFTQEPVATAEPVLQFSLRASGAINIDNGIYQSVQDDGDTQYDSLMQLLTPYLQGDLSIATLSHVMDPDSTLSTVNQPSTLASSLASVGFTAINLNHYSIFDYGLSGLANTETVLQNVGITPYGPFSSEEDANMTTIVDAGGVKVALLGFQTGVNTTSELSTAEQAFAYEAVDVDVMTASIQKAKDDGAQVVLVSLCWGKVDDSTPTDSQKLIAQQLANAGADIIIGTRTEVLQTVEILTADRGDGQYHPVLCAYNLGTLVNGNRDKRTYLASIIIEADVNFDTATQTVSFDNLAYTPTYSWRMSIDSQWYYRTLPNILPYPDFVDDTQAGVMERCLTTIATALEGSIFEQMSN